jgi:hypothetical protein
MSIALKLTWVFLFVIIALLISFLKDKKATTRKIIFFGDSLTQAGCATGRLHSLDERYSLAPGN